MTAAEYLNETKKRLEISSDYELAKRLQSTPGHIAEIRSGKRAMPLDVAYKIAITLEIDPAEVIAELESQREKNPARAAFWRSFLARAAVLAVTVACTLALNFSGGVAGVQSAANGGFKRRFYFA